MIKSHKIRLFPNSSQTSGLLKACGCARFAYNWGITTWNAMYAAGEKPTELKLRKKLNSLKAAEFPWMYESTKTAPEQAIKNLGRAWDKYFKSLKQGTKVGRPKFKKKSNVNQKFYVDCEKGRIKDRRLCIPHIPGIKMSEEIEIKGKVLSYHVSLDVDRWYVSITVETDESKNHTNDFGTVGVDLGIKELATLSDGKVFKNPRILKKNENRLKRLQRRVSKSKKRGNNYRKKVLKLALLHRKIRLMRKTNLHKLTSFLSFKNYSTIVIEDLAVSNMLKNHKLAKALSDCSFSIFRKFLVYKCKEFNTNLVVAPRFYASSKICSHCGNKKIDLKLSERVYTCYQCGNTIDRDLNAALNLAKIGTCCPEYRLVEE